jgi:hypothetical protein
MDRLVYIASSGGTPLLIATERLYISPCGALARLRALTCRLPAQRLTRIPALYTGCPPTLEYLVDYIAI